MEYEIVRDLTRKKQQLLKGRFLKSLSLEQLAVRLVDENIGFYLNAQDEEQQLQSLPGTLRNKILQNLLTRKCSEENGNGAEFGLLIKAFKLLLSPRTTSIELNGLLSYCPDKNKAISAELSQQCIQLFKEISCATPKLKNLTLMKIRGAKNWPEQMRPQMLESLLALKHLNRLHIELFSFHLDEILHICKNIPTLQYVNVTLEYKGAEFDCPSVRELEGSLSNLKEFIYDTQYHWTSFNWLRWKCIENLPNLEIAHFYCDVNDALKYRPIRWMPIVCVSGFKSKLKHLYIDLESHKSALGSLLPSFPNVTHLMVDWCGDSWQQPELEDRIQPLLEFKRLKCVNVGNFAKCKAPLFKKLCQTYGPRLHTLCVSSMEVCDLDLKIVVTHCRALQKLALQNIRFFYSEMPTEPIATLRELEWKFTNVAQIPHDEDNRLMRLAYILASPKLEKVELVGFRFDLDDLKEVSAMIERRQILKNLHTFNFKFC